MQAVKPIFVRNAMWALARPEVLPGGDNWKASSFAVFRVSTDARSVKIV
jgi:hypothetical protein